MLLFLLKEHNIVYYKDVDRIHNIDAYVDADDRHNIGICIEFDIVKTCKSFVVICNSNNANIIRYTLDNRLTNNNKDYRRDDANYDEDYICYSQSHRLISIDNTIISIVYDSAW